MKKLAALTLSLFLTVGIALADSPKDAPKDTPKADAQPATNTTAAKPAPAKTNAEIAAEMEELRQALQVQQEQLQLLKEELAKRDRQIEEAREAAAAANSRATDANVKATEAVATSTEAKTNTSALSSSMASLAASNAAGNAAGSSSSAADPNAPVVAGGGQVPDTKGPTTILYKGVSITPGGFIAAETVNRQHAESAFATPFEGETAVLYPGAGLTHTSEMNFSASQSRLSLLAETKLSSAKVTGYYESDFLGSAVTSNNRQTNSYVFRLRQAWGRIDLDNGWSFAGGQQWSLATENKKGIVNRGEDTPLTIDPNYVVGFTWDRSPGLRAIKSFGDKFALAVSMENAQTTIAGHGFSSYSNTPVTGSATIYENFFLNAPGNAAGLYNSLDATGYTVNKLPDFIVKAALDPGWGHYEVFGIVSDFRNRVYPCAVVGTTAGNFPTPATPDELACPVDGSLKPSVLGAYNDSRTAGGVGVSALVPIFSHKIDIGAKAVYGDGIGRYGGAQMPDATARPDGTLAPIHDAQWLARIEWHTTPKLDLFAYFGGEYAGRAAYTGYDTIKVTNTAAIPGCGAVGQQPCPGGGIQPSYPALATTSISTTGEGGYGNPAANNTSCWEEALPTPAQLSGGAAGAAGAAGFPGGTGTCTGDARYIGELTFGFWHKVYQGEKGRLQWGATYSYLYKVGWSGNGDLSAGSAGIAPKAINNIVYTSLRYYLP
jgi:hypothetical protein